MASLREKVEAELEQIDSGCPCGLCLLQGGGETICEYAGAKKPCVQVSGRAVAGKVQRLKSRH